MATFQQLAKKMDVAFTTKKHGEDTIIILKKGSPQWMTDIIHEAHMDRMPDDETYKNISYIVDLASEYDDPEEAMEAVYSDLEPSVYTGQLLAWLSDHTYNTEYVDRAYQEFGAEDFNSALMMAQKIWIDEMAGIVIQGLQEQAEE